MDPTPARPSLRRYSHLDQPIAITAGEPAGIGPDLCLELAASAASGQLVIIADPDVLLARAERLGVAYPDNLQILPIECPEPDVCGSPSTANAQAMLKGLQMAVDGCLQGRFSALVTAPMQKSIVNDADIAFSGHTEFLAEATGGQKPVMMLVAGDLRVALASTHLPLRDVPNYLTTAGIREVIEILHADLQARFGIASPEIIVCGLNPHAGEGGHLGHEDAEVVAPAIDACVAAGMRVRGPLPADTAFTPAAGHKDAVVAMYHDQGLPVLKYAGFGNAVNVTLGLPIIRTSVDHGTALDIAGTGKADPGSMYAAIDLAAQMVQR